jgi:Holliday junction resolvase RusA-like endonuclease
MSELKFFIPCVPPRATAQQKGAFVAGGKVRFYKKARIAQAESDWISLLRPHAPESPLQGPLLVDVSFVFPFKKTERKADRERGWVRSHTRPDIDNLCKMLFDAMSRLGFWNDDGQIADMRARKMRGQATGLAVYISEIGAGE